MKKSIIKSIFVVALAATMMVGCTVNNNPSDETTAAPTEEPTVAPTEEPKIDYDSIPYCGDYTVSKTISTAMVFQRNEYINVWGWAEKSEAGKKLSAEFMGETAYGLVDESGEWKITFKTLHEATLEPQTLKVTNGTTEMVYENILVGDVYFVTGQSNCAYGMNIYWSTNPASGDAAQKDINVNLPIRICYNSQTVFNKNCGVAKRGDGSVAYDVKGRQIWKESKTSTVSTFSAIGYLFGYNIYKMTDGQIPIGLIEIDGNGQPLGAFVSNEVAEKYGTDTWNESKGYYVTTGCNGDQARFLYNEYFAPYTNMAVAGMVWYQGESDCADREANRYAEVWTAQVNYLREQHTQINKDFPVFFIEFPSMYTKPSNYKGTNSWAYMDVGKIRAVMGSMVTMTKNVYQVQSSDVWNDRTYWNSLHPDCKWPQAVRAAKIALAHYGMANMTMDNASGPIVESVTFSSDGTKCTIKFKNVGTGLATKDGAAEVKGFNALSATNTISKSTKVTAKIVGKDTVEVTSSTALAGICYNAITTYYFGDEVTLMNSAGIPCGAFLFNK